MTRLAVAALLLVGCAAPFNSPASAPGQKRFSVAGTGKTSALGSKARPRHRHLSAASRNLRRPAMENQTHNWTDVAACESSGDWQANTGNGFYGGLQFTQSTWASFGGLRYAARADLASRAAQISIAERVLRTQGPNAWPVCSAGAL